MIQPYLFIAPSAGKGRGVFTRRTIPANTIIEVSPVLVMSGEDRKLLDQTLLHDYIFEWGALRDQCCMALGYIALYNHAVPSNCEYFMEYGEALIFVKTMRRVRAREELTINYNGPSDNRDPVWFEVAR